MKGNYSTMEVDGRTVRLEVVEPWPYTNRGLRSYWVMDGERCLGTVIRWNTCNNEWRVDLSLSGDSLIRSFGTRRDAVEFVVRSRA